MKKTLVRVIGVIVLIEVAWLVLANIALNLPLTQELVNNHKPEKYAVRWERAWSWFPLRVNALGISANGQTSSQQWQADVPSASASVSVLPLLKRTVRISGVEAQDVEFRLRPRPKPDRDYGAVREFFPPIRDRDPDLPAAPKAKKAGNGWNIVVDDIRARGKHDVWIYQVHAALSGKLVADISYTTRGGPFSLSAGEARVELGSLQVNAEEVVSPGGTLEGRFEMAPFVPSEHRGLKALAFLTADATVDLPVNSLDFLDVYLRRFDGMEVDGRGTWRGRLHYEEGNIVSGTDMAVSASELILNASPYKVRGTGDISVKAGSEVPDTIDLHFGFGTLAAFHDSSETALFTGEKLDIGIRGRNRLLLDEPRQTGNNSFVVDIPSVAVPDLRAYQYLLPEKWQILLNGGTGELTGRAEMSSTDLTADLRLVSDEADVAFKDYRFGANLDLGVTARGGTADRAYVDLSGSYLKLDEARVAGAAQEASKSWQASFSITEGSIGVPVTEAETGETGFRHLMLTLKDKSFQEVLATMDADLLAHLNVSDLGWLNALLRNDFDLAISGAGDAQVDIDVRSGWLAEGTKVRVEPRGLKVQVLDYVARGEGLVNLEVERGGEAPDMILAASLQGGDLRRRGEETAVIDDVTMEVAARAQGVTLGEASTVSSIDLRIPKAHVRDMSAYNQFFPGKVPLQLTGGEASLTADVHLEQEAAGGYVKLQTSGLTSRLDDQQLSGEIALDINLKGGVPANMDFDISGSSLRLDDIRVRGDQKQFDDAGWVASFELDKARVVWERPVVLDVEGAISMNDSRPIVALLANERGKYGWIEKLLTVKDIKGTAKVVANAGDVVVPYALAGSDKIDVGVKGLINDDTREGIFFARFRKLNGILKAKDGKRNFDIIGARKKFDAYSPGQAGVSTDAAKEAQPERPADEPKKDTLKKQG